MKTIHYIILLLPISLILFGCTPHENVRVEPDGFDTVPSPYFLTGIVLPTQLEVYPFSYPSKTLANKYSDLPGLWVLLGGESYVCNQDKTREQFEQYVQKFEKGNYNRPVAPGNPHPTILWDIEHIEVEALSDYNAQYPAGSSLRNLCVLTYESFYPYINSGYVTTTDSDYTGETFLNMQGMTGYLHRALTGNWQIKIPAMDYPDASYKITPSFYYLGFLEFTQAPDEPKQKIRVTLTLENGEKLRAETEIDFTVKP